jgi:hypothetical protein
MTSLRLRFAWLSVYAVSMAFLESAVVVYLRELYYPKGFAFPLVSMQGIVAVTEVLREAATLFMLLSVAVVAGKTLRQRLAWFIYCFAVWDIFYYVFLVALIHWPESWLTWDILFLIPVAWTGPVLAPVLVSLSMIALALVMLSRRSESARFPLWRISLLVGAGATLVFVSMIWDFSVYMSRQASYSSIFDVERLDRMLSVYVPHHFPWLIFAAGMLCIGAGITAFYRNTRPST